MDTAYEHEASPTKKRRLDVFDMAYLGPPGTYGHQAARAFSAYFQEDYNLIPCRNIKAVYNSPSSYLVLPLQNTLHGPVIETVDCLLSTLVESGDWGKEVGRSNGGSSRATIIADLDLPIRHCLVAKKGVELKDVRWVRSHEQALGQSSKYLDANLPDAERISWASTAGAAVSLLENESDGFGAAICSKSVLDDHPELHVLYEGTQSISNNYTRFLLLSRSNHSPLPRNPFSKTQNTRSTTHFYALPDISLFPPLLFSVGTGRKPLTLDTIHTRPVPAEKRNEATGRYASWVFLELSGESKQSENVRDGGVFLGQLVYRVRI